MQLSILTLGFVFSYLVLRYVFLDTFRLGNRYRDDAEYDQHSTELAIHRSKLF